MPKNDYLSKVLAHWTRRSKSSASTRIGTMARRSLSKEIEDIREKLGNHSIVLVGLMGAGKSSIGRMAKPISAKASAA
jgi:putative ribosome biogenesis GTPase RsgA